MRLGTFGSFFSVSPRARDSRSDASGGDEASANNNPMPTSNKTLEIVQRSTVRHQRDSTGSPTWAGMLPCTISVMV